MKLKVLDIMLCRTPVFSLKDTLEERWPELKILIQDASPPFYQAIADKNISELNTPNGKTEYSVWKYFNRAKYRATPFGGFAAITAMPVVADSFAATILSQRIIAHRFTDWKEKDRIIADPAEAAVNVNWFLTNSSFYTVGGEHRFIRFRNGCFEIAAVADFPQLDAILKRCRDKTGKQDIYQYMKSCFQLLSRDVDELLEQLITLQLLFTERHPNITGDDYFERLKGKNQVVGNNYIIAERQLLSGGFNKEKLKDIASLISFLSLHLPDAENETLITFRNAFLKKFERAAVPLAIAMDPEIGIGYGNLAHHQKDDDLEAILDPAKVIQREGLPIAYSALHRFLLNNLMQNSTIRLEEFENRDTGATLALPNTFSILLHFWQKQPVIESIGGCTASALLGRFTIASPELEKMGQEITVLEEKANPDILFFDIAYQAEKEIDNVNRRKQLYNLELPLLSWSCAPSPIHFDDLLVLVRGTEVILWSRKHNKRLVPRIPSAYNYTRSDLAVYRFLCDLQHQGIRSDLTFRIQQFFPDLHHYPRVVYKDVIISPAMWRVPEDFLQFVKTGDPLEAKKMLLNWLQKTGINFLFKAGRADQTLCFDPYNGEDIGMFILYCRQHLHSSIYISEALIANGVDLSDEKGNSYAAQYVVNYGHENAIYPPYENCSEAKEIGQMAGNMLIPGGEWLYFEIYCHPSRSNSLLTKQVALFLNAAKKQIRKWFFIRYEEPTPHIRLRVQLKVIQQGYLLVSQFKSLLERACSNGLITDIQIKTYFRETARYGAARINLVEKLFSIDSNYALYLLARSNTTEQLYSAALRFMQRLLTFRFKDIEGQLMFVHSMADNFSSELGLNQENFKRLNVSFQKHKKKFSDDLSFNPARRFVFYEKVFAEIMHHCDSEAEKSNMLADLLHMHINRLFITDQRSHEAVLYHYLLKILKTRRATSAVSTECSAVL